MTPFYHLFINSLFNKFSVSTFFIIFLKRFFLVDYFPRACANKKSKLTFSFNLLTLPIRIPGSVYESKMAVESDNPGAEYYADQTSEINIVGRSVNVGPSFK